MFVHELESTDFAPGPYPEVGFRVVCGKGTYVRSLVDDMARALGGRAHLSELRRTRVGSLDLSISVPSNDLTDYVSVMLSPAEALADLPRVIVDPGTAEGVAHGMKFATGPLGEIEPGRPTAVVDETGSLLAVYRREGHHTRAEVVLS